METTALLKKFKELPALYAGRRAELTFFMEENHFSAFDAPELGLAMGMTVRQYVELEDDYHIYLYAQGKTAEQALELPDNVSVVVEAKLLYGIKEEPIYINDEMKFVVERIPKTGILIESIKSYSTDTL